VRGWLPWRRTSSDLLIQVVPLLRALRTEPQLGAYLDDVVEEVVDIVDAM
jgi:hypothetical protein